MKILVIDGQGGRLGSQIIKSIKEKLPDEEITAIGTNSVATSAMMKMGATRGATGENPVVVTAKKADVIIGPIGIVIANAMLGEITANMALAISESNATRILLPINKCENYIAGVNNLSMSNVIDDAINKIISLKTMSCN